MKIDKRLFRSKLAHRVFLAFVLCAVIPIGIVGVVSYQSVTGKLVSQASLRLRQASKALGLSLFERLLFAETELSAVSRALLSDPDVEVDRPHRARLSAVEIVDGQIGPSGSPADPSGGGFRNRQREAHLEEGMSFLMPFPAEGDSAPVRLALRLDPADPDSKQVVGELDPVYFWGLDGGNSVPAEAEFCVFEETGRLIYGSFGGCREAWLALREEHHGQSGADMETVFPVASMSGERYVAGHRDLFLRGRFLADDWVVVVCQPLSTVVRPVQRWRVVFPAVVVLAFCVVLLMIIGAIRKNLDPIDRLREATVRLADRDFDHEVVITTGDEFENLADSFNQMSARLRRQFGALSATATIHRAILSSLDTEQVVEAAVAGVIDYFECGRAAIVECDRDRQRVTRTSARSGDPAPRHEPELRMGAELRERLGRVQQGSVIGHDLPVPPELTSILDLAEMDSVLAVPVFIRGSVAAVIGLGFEEARVLPEEDLDHLTQLADQLAVALSNAGMLKEVNDFSHGTLEALARAVDAKSPWTAGHSDRVTRLAVAIGDAYGLDAFELSKLYRGAMLHDIGKLGIPQALLDKKGRLDQIEFDVVRSHTMIGERILEPVGAFTELMPVVTQHHERFDGSGYPSGRVGSAIDIKARILAVADVYDAMTNPRPYRDSVDPIEVVEMIRRQSGTQFDPDVVRAFLEVIDASGGIEHLAMLKKDFTFIGSRDGERGWAPKARQRGESS